MQHDDNVNLHDPWVRGFEMGEVDPTTFDHRQHLYVAWCYLGVLTVEDALSRYARYLRQLVERLGAPEKFHRTVTWYWLAVLDRAMAESPGRSFEELVAEHPELLRSESIRLRYPDLQLAGDAARRHFVWPDR